MIRITTVVILAVGLFAGCQNKPGTNDPAPEPRADTETRPGDAPSANTDPCATRLHDLGGPLLLYYAMNKRLPARLEELQTVPGFEGVEVTCPVSRRPYRYDPNGTITAPGKARVILYDAVPAHGGSRWAVSIVEPTGEGPLITKVVAIPETSFSASPAPGGR